MISYLLSDPESLDYDLYKTYQGHPLDSRSMPCRLQGMILNTQRTTSPGYLPTIHYYPHILHKAVDDFEGLRCSHPSLVLGESVESFQYRLDVLLSKELL